MIYVISGHPRSGTTMMMSACEAGGLPIVYNVSCIKDVDKRMKELHGASWNPGSFYENGFERHEDNLDFLDGKCVKIFLGVIPLRITKLTHVNFKVLNLVRDADDREASYYRLHPNTKDAYQKILMDEWGAKAFGYDHIHIDSMNYDDIVEDPLGMMLVLKNEYGWPIDPEAAALDIFSGRSKRVIQDNPCCVNA